MSATLTKQIILLQQQINALKLGGSLVYANNGVSLVNSDTVRLGQTVSQVGNPAIFTTSRELPLGAFNFTYLLNGTTNNSTSQNMSIIMSNTNRLFISKTTQIPTNIPDNFGPLTVVGRLKAATDLSPAGAAINGRYKPFIAAFVGGPTNAVAAIFNVGATDNEAASLVEVQFQSDRTALQTLSGWMSGLRSSVQFTTAAFLGTVANYADIMVGATHTQSANSTITNRYGLYIVNMTNTNTTNTWGIYQASATDKNFFAGILITTGLPTYADEAAAVIGGIATGTQYKTATGELRIKL